MHGEFLPQWTYSICMHTICFLPLCGNLSVVPVMNPILGISDSGISLDLYLARSLAEFSISESLPLLLLSVNHAYRLPSQCTVMAGAIQPAWACDTCIIATLTITNT